VIDAKNGQVKVSLAVGKLTDEEIWKRFRKAQKQLDKLINKIK
jgi:hypothetical protein